MYVKVCTPVDLDQLIELVLPVTKIYGIDTISTGWQAKHVESIRYWLDNPAQARIVAAFSQDKILGFCAQTFSNESPRWLLNLCYISEINNRNQFNASKIGGPLVDALIEGAEERGKFEFFYCVRDSGRKRLDMTLAATKFTSQSYEIENFEILPPFTSSKSAKIAESILGSVNGKNKKTIIIRRGFKKHE